MPGPNYYLINEKSVMHKSPSWVIKRIKEVKKKGSRSPRKSTGPGPATYTTGEINERKFKKSTIVYIGRKDPKDNADRISFTRQMIISKRFVPGVGHYEPNRESINIPYMR